ncbi:aminotransferase class III-fold pyridoxal phosphate-dependent enzyme [Actinoplanes flavus]|uniref:Diaminobutyrate--2-oxoglutarate transaminase n=1 Tax=Actinoplanes flavus TaxID=2820290 RepID=A0ABS3USI0_9ACTN|nr:aminotransferase class III-fold pyridoxal phosphate-dependent enzyme [Actinoplanes flavus]MBO3741528.1 aminotransferase class III-fold pyridoxal phosphate-dependent enzyme [Actinoplanes flavus]
MPEASSSRPGAAAASAPFHLSDLDPARMVLDGFADSCLDPRRPVTSLSPGEHLASNPALFTSGGSWPRDVWADTALGVWIDGSMAETKTPLDLLDLCSMTCNTVLGINDPWVKLKQTAFLLSSHPHYLPARIGSGLYYRTARRILRCLDRFGEPGDFVINLRQCNGSDAVELALHAAWKAAADSPARRRLATFDGSYHGESVVGSLVMQDHSAEGSGRALLDHVDNATSFPSPTCDEAGYLTPQALATLATLERDGDSYFAVLIEPVQWRNSVHAIPLEFLRKLRDICTRKSICLIFDEVQNAFGYAGTIFFAQHCGVCPDIIATGKALTSGHGALGIVVAKKEFSAIETPFGGKTNSGDMLSFVAVDAVMDRLLGIDPDEAETLPAWLPPGLAADLRTGLLTTAYPVVAGLLDGLVTDLQRRFPSLLGPATGLGLLRGLTMLDADGRPSGRLAGQAAKICMRHGVYVRRAGTAVYLKPSLALRPADVDTALIRLSRTFDELCRLREEGPPS